ncbi:hypothetical protein GE061_018701 [Apolygus lucorum]|uniref:Uncharacterized protein n=1 Tax=Apolygus lucorum TaxID=248454 RepID=A0A8S9X880_APOLU|nr:hypothetical protein GE061_018701 [Apolygus lucorum]
MQRLIRTTLKDVIREMQAEGDAEETEDANAKKENVGDKRDNGDEQTRTTINKRGSGGGERREMRKRKRANTTKVPCRFYFVICKRAEGGFRYKFVWINSQGRYLKRLEKHRTDRKELFRLSQQMEKLTLSEEQTLLRLKKTFSPWYIYDIQKGTLFTTDQKRQFIEALSDRLKEKGVATKNSLFEFSTPDGKRAELIEFIGGIIEDLLKDFDDIQISPGAFLDENIGDREEEIYTETKCKSEDEERCKQRVTETTRVWGDEDQKDERSTEDGDNDSDEIYRCKRSRMNSTKFDSDEDGHIDTKNPH